MEQWLATFNTSVYRLLLSTHTCILLFSFSLPVAIARRWWGRKGVELKRGGARGGWWCHVLWRGEEQMCHLYTSSPFHNTCHGCPPLSSRWDLLDHMTYRLDHMTYRNTNTWSYDLQTWSHDLQEHITWPTNLIMWPTGTQTLDHMT